MRGIKLKDFPDFLKSQGILFILNPAMRAFQKLGNRFTANRLVDSYAQFGYGGIKVALRLEFTNDFRRKLTVATLESFFGAAQPRPDSSSVEELYRLVTQG